MAPPPGREASGWRERPGLRLSGDRASREAGGRGHLGLADGNQTCNRDRLIWGGMGETR